MSWSATRILENGTLTEKATQLQQGHGESESKVALEKAQDTALKLIESGALGKGNFNIAMSGHANPSNQTPG